MFSRTRPKIALNPRPCRRMASVLIQLPPMPLSCQPSLDLSPHIVTPAASPLTTPSNNYFHSSNIPQKSKARLALIELQQVLKSSKDILAVLQKAYVNHEKDTEDVLLLLKELQKKQKALESNLLIVKPNKTE
ncbi:hypothetical protein PHYBLDRAFT_149086 [Phycomyces blakesleeanus NRRL 1555(-)]|uniref:Uncharacterized protein n=1 Tax=Phycomyces blakesleeanus (strain ATCC 8743b / DSM 1359 / FGSC 10004 / NBRC 33097 / NRRL 1555) TaxID=763407 RepID=A0A167L9M8_PHYB8|nr:hypothetical protein PHYBLDRAFT_149086 [Phycomyces blakesleeanus NRRL 1555(-)]OAD69908.1 hypothetical protein PHYBLDRAFT_149086 [Phycomyces blakesleeanus NRRL 1555(-)]|eukprot:XP_018287948.1 hypothetical protein PHYBLDRAFT_149086 [Phycomyces blakesleeanus NRRL 1555(-)]